VTGFHHPLPTTQQPAPHRDYKLNATVRITQHGPRYATYGRIIDLDTKRGYARICPQRPGWVDFGICVEELVVVHQPEIYKEGDRVLYFNGEHMVEGVCGGMGKAGNEDFVWVGDDTFYYFEIELLEGIDG
jgi:hypothetical protein